MSSVYCSILIPTHNRCAILRQTLKSLQEMELPAGIPVEIVVVANACTDETIGVVEEAAAGFPCPLRVVVEPTPGLNLARNRAVAEAKGTILALLDDDVWVSPEWLTAMLSGYATTGADLAAGPVALWWGEVERPSWFGEELDGLLSAKDHGTEIVPLTEGHQAVGANFSFRRAVFEQINGFVLGLDRTGSNLLSGGDTDFLDRAIAAGFKMYYFPGCAVRHWVPRHRATKSHIASIAYGRGLSQVFQKRQFGTRQVLRQLIGRNWIMLTGLTHEVFAKCRGDEPLAMLARAKWMTGLGGIVAVFQRLLGRSPLKAQ